MDNRDRREKNQIVNYDTSIDPSDWWPSFEKKFDQGVAPDPIHSVVVPIDESAKVMALAFDTSRAPYVIKLDPGGKSEKEVPIRRSAGTRSASRSDLLRMLVPLITTPDVSIISADLSPTYRAPTPVDQRSGASMEAGAPTRRPENTFFNFQVAFFFTYSASVPLFLPRHEMRMKMKMDFGNQRSPIVLTTCPQIFVGKDAPPAPAVGIHRRTDGFSITGSGAQFMQFGFHADGDLRAELSDCSSLMLEATFPIAGSDQRSVSSVSLRRSPPTVKGGQGPYIWALDGWTMNSIPLE